MGALRAEGTGGGAESQMVQPGLGNAYFLKIIVKIPRIKQDSSLDSGHNGCSSGVIPSGYDRDDPFSPQRVG